MSAAAGPVPRQFQVQLQKTNVMSRNRKRTGLGPPRVQPAVTLESPASQIHREHLGRGPLRGARRTTPRTSATLELTGGALDGRQFPVTLRESAEGGLAFMLKESLPVAQACRIITNPGEPTSQTRQAEVVRARPISNGRYEVAVRLHRPNQPVGAA